MDFVQFDDPREFQARAWPFLLKHEAENNLMLGIAGRLAAPSPVAPSSYSGPPLLGTVEQNGQVLAALMMTPPHKLVLTRCAPEQIAFIAERLHASGAAVPGFLGPRDTASAFVSVWARLTGCEQRLAMAMRIYQLDRVMLAPGVRGHMAEAALTDMEWLLPWTLAFHEAIHEPAGDAEGALKGRIARHEIVLWKDSTPVSMAASGGPTPNGIRVNFVYTPPEQRCRGYATALVAALSQRLLDAGRRFCFLFTDLANPTSNSIYQKIGYRPVCDVDAYDCVPRTSEKL